MDRHVVSIRRPWLMAILTWAVLVSALGATLTSAQTGPGPAAEDATPTCDPWGIDPCPSPTPVTQSLSGGLTWTTVSAPVDDGELGSTWHWDSSITADLAWDDDVRLFVPRSGSYSYSSQYTGHCTASVAGSGILSTDPYAGAAESGVGFMTAEWATAEDGALGVRFGIWRDAHDIHCKATRAFPASQSVDPGNTIRPLCTWVRGSPTGAGTFSIACVEQDIEGTHVIVSGTLVLGA
jgi:hypothetical protein